MNARPHHTNVSQRISVHSQTTPADCGSSFDPVEFSVSNFYGIGEQATEASLNFIFGIYLFINLMKDLSVQRNRLENSPRAQSGKALDSRVELIRSCSVLSILYVFIWCFRYRIINVLPSFVVKYVCHYPCYVKHSIKIVLLSVHVWNLRLIKPDERLFEMTSSMKQYQIMQCYIFPFLFKMSLYV